ncbi:hypothetical protein K435DRAFT_878969 [Dendrothele bispora CBS 962.96]|uniref:Uncharacterized protein n=1 Tax=Dendrothele bispora (strain CBS 962.96) TaxID=1314807 RepID=A0A4S8KM52_DENBC|nr:hypothetical protein K435DRAFT_878969 [Dendrothele bispora CBS 962.96]
MHPSSSQSSGTRVPLYGRGSTVDQMNPGPSQNFDNRALRSSDYSSPREADYYDQQPRSDYTGEEDLSEELHYGRGPHYSNERRADMDPRRSPEDQRRPRW